MDVLPSYVGKRLTFTLPSALGSQPIPSTSHTLKLPSNSTHPSKASSTPIQSIPIDQSTQPPPSTSNTLTSPLANQTPARRDLESARTEGLLCSTQARDPRSNTSKKPETRFDRSGKGKAKTLPLSRGHILLSKLKSSGEGSSKEVGSLLRLESPSKLVVLGRSSKQTSVPSPLPPKSPPQSLSDPTESDSGKPLNRVTSHSSGVIQSNDPSSNNVKQVKKPRINSSASVKSNKNINPCPSHPSSKRRKVIPPDELHDTTRLRDVPIDDEGAQVDILPSKSSTERSQPVQRLHPASLNAANHTEILNLDSSNRPSCRTQKTHSSVSKSQRDQPLREANLNLPCESTSSHQTANTSRQSSSSSSSLKSHVKKSKANAEQLTLPLKGISSHQLLYQPFEIENSAHSTVSTATNDSKLNAIRSKPSSSESEAFGVSTSVPVPRGGTCQIVERKQPRPLSCDTQITPTVVSTPRRSRSGSSNDSNRMKRLAARIFTPRAVTNQAADEQVEKNELQDQDPGPSERVIQDHHAVTDPATTEHVDVDHEDSEQQIYIIADRLIREEEDEARWFEDEEGARLSLETQRLILRIKSQLNPADIISISIRKLIEDEIERLDRPPDRLPNDQGDTHRVQGIESERGCLESFLDHFKAHMLDYSDQLVRFGMLKLRLKQLNSRIKHHPSIEL